MLIHLVILVHALKDITVFKELHHQLLALRELIFRTKVLVHKLSVLSVIQVFIVVVLDYQLLLKPVSKVTIAQRRVLQQLKFNAELGIIVLQEQGPRLNVLLDFIRILLDSIVAKFARLGNIAKVEFRLLAPRELIVRYELG